MSSFCGRASVAVGARSVIDGKCVFLAVPAGLGLFERITLIPCYRGATRMHKYRLELRHILPASLDSRLPLPLNAVGRPTVFNFRANPVGWPDGAFCPAEKLPSITLRKNIKEDVHCLNT